LPISYTWKLVSKAPGYISLAVFFDGGWLLSKENWEKSQDETAKNFDGKVIGASGSGQDKMDIAGGGRWEDFLIENKYTTKKSFSLNKSILQKAKRQAKVEGKEHIVLIEFEDTPRNHRYILIEEKDFFNLL
jgi:hypothetical protein